MSAASDAREKLVAAKINDLNMRNLTADRPRADVSYADVKVIYKPKTGPDKEVWIEVKMNHTDNLGNIRVSWNGKKWVTSEKGGITPLKKFMTDLLNTGEGKESADRFLNDLAKYIGKNNKNDIIVPTTLGGLDLPNAITHIQMQNFLKTKGTQYFINISDVDLGKLVTDHYNEGKSKPVSYMQAADDFYLLGDLDELNLKGIHPSIPKLKGKGNFKMRVGMRTKYYELQPEIKITDMGKSNFSLTGGVGRKNPFEGLK
jgi:hypothetical protein